MNDKINGIILDNSVYVLISDDGDYNTCKDCDIYERCERDFGHTQGYCYMSEGHLMGDYFKFSQELTDNLQLNERRRIKLNGK